MLNLIALSLAQQSAHAADFYMAGGGVTLGTIVAPGEYPASFPSDAPDMGFGIKNDVSLGAVGKIYLDKYQRIGGRVNLGTGLGSYGYGSTALTLEYDRVQPLNGGFDGILGAGLGVGTQSFTSTTDNHLSMSTYLIPVRGGIVYRDNTRAYELNLVPNLVFPGTQRYTPSGGDEVRLDNQLFGGAFYWSIGLEAAMMWGDFKPPKKKKKNKKKGKTSASTSKSNNSSNSPTKSRPTRRRN